MNDLSSAEVGKCCICKKMLTRKDIGDGTAKYFEGFPGDHVCCRDHPGVEAEYDRLLKECKPRDGKN